MNPHNRPLGEEIDGEKVEHDNGAEGYRHNSDDLHSKEDTPIPCLWLLQAGDFARSRSRGKMHYERTPRFRRLKLRGALAARRNQDG